MTALAGVHVLTAQTRPQVEIRRVDFDTVRDDWLQVAIVLRANRNERPDARDSRYVERIRIRCMLSYEREPAGRFDFYTSEAEVVALEQNQDKAVSFYLPGIVVERDRLPDHPFAYLVELEIAGEPQALQANGVSSNIRNNPVAVRSMKSRAESEGVENEGILRPDYLTPESVKNGSDPPAYIRRTVKNP